MAKDPNLVGAEHYAKRLESMLRKVIKRTEFEQKSNPFSIKTCRILDEAEALLAELC